MRLSNSSPDIESSLIYRRPGPQMLAAMRAMRTVPAPGDADQVRALRTAARRTGRPVVEIAGGRVMLGWDAETEGLWAAEGMDAVRAAHPAQPRHLRALAACVRCCWPDPQMPIYPSRSAPVDAVVTAAVRLTSGGDAQGEAARRHARGALTTLDAAGLIIIDSGGWLTLGPVIASWTARDVAVLRQAWTRLPGPSAVTNDSIGDDPAEEQW